MRKNRSVNIFNKLLLVIEMIGRFKIVEKFVFDVHVVIAHVTFRNDYVCLHAFVNNLKCHPLKNKNIF